MPAQVAIIGGSGFYSILQDAEKFAETTEYGKPSDDITIGTIGEWEVAFIPRHGFKHTIPPSKVPYRANITALKTMGVKRIIATNAVGSLKADYEPGDIVLFDQFFNMTSGREDTFFDKAQVVHVSTADPYCPELRKVAGEVAESLGIKVHKTGTVVVVNGPRFSSRAESKFFSSQGFHTINMTQYPEVALAKESAICYLGVGIVTDYDVGIEGRDDIKPVSVDSVNETFAKNMQRTSDFIMKILPKIPKERGCNCDKSLEGTGFERK